MNVSNVVLPLPTQVPAPTLALNESDSQSSVIRTGFFPSFDWLTIEDAEAIKPIANAMRTVIRSNVVLDMCPPFGLEVNWIQWRMNARETSVYWQNSATPS